jgi:F0F1-type ATP synthase delta subunit
MEYTMQILDKEVMTSTSQLTEKQKKELIERLENQYGGQVSLVETFTYSPVNITIK